jgi:hypothetical protein
MKPVALVTLAAVLAPVRLCGQTVLRRYDATFHEDNSYNVASWRLGTGGGRSWKGAAVHYGKWALAAGAIGFTILAQREHNRSQRLWTQLLDICRKNNQDCALDDSGRYVNYQAELLYDESIYYDHRARHRLVAGQLSLLGAAAMFIADRSSRGEKPDNIPLHGLAVAPSRDGVLVGMRIAF